MTSQKVEFVRGLLFWRKPESVRLEAGANREV
jgi:hypothetical protein